jgi:hypothetical protein
MTATQIEAILGASSMDKTVNGTGGMLHIPSMRYITFKKDRMVLSSDVNNIRFKFNTSKDIMEVVYVRLFSRSGTIPPHENYDAPIDGNSDIIFEYMSDVNGDLVKDYYSFDSITTIGLI